ncbi:efflux RND transporter periplasmic adaptor subunit, partial [Arthrospira platensis SPKY1]|nr:efflux RND transporter periplasmic adaptor subunit [Arthrospira platensis SPKY1]
AKAISDYEIEQARYSGLKAELRMMGMDVESLERDGIVQETLSLKAPVSGHITAIHTHLGALADPGMPLYELVDPGHIHLELSIFTKDVVQVQPGQAIECRVPGLEEWYPAKVYLVGREIDPATKTVRVHGHFEKEPDHLLPGTYVQARITTHADSAWALPQGALAREDGLSVVYVQKGDHFEAVPVQ